MNMQNTETRRLVDIPREELLEMYAEHKKNTPAHEVMSREGMLNCINRYRRGIFQSELDAVSWSDLDVYIELNRIRKECFVDIDGTPLRA